MNWTAIISAVLTVGSAASMAFGQPALAAVISDPHTAMIATGVVTTVTAAVSAFSAPVHKAV